MTALSERVHHPQALESLGADWERRLDEDTDHPWNVDPTQAAVLERVATQPNTVVFVAKKAYFNQIRMSVALRRQGIQTVAVALDGPTRRDVEPFFDHTLALSLRAFLSWWSNTNGVQLHTQGWLFRYHVPTLIEAFKPAESRHVVEFMDLHRFMFPVESLPTTLPSMQIVWGSDCERNHRQQLACETYLAKHADGLVFPGDEGHQAAFGVDDERAVNFMSYPLADFFAPARHLDANEAKRVRTEPRLVFAGGVPTSQPRRIAAIFSDAQLHGVVREIGDAGLPFQVFNNPLIAPADAYSTLYPQHMAMMRRYPTYRFDVGASPWAIVPRLATFDYGLMLYDFDGVIIGEPHFAHLVPTKLFLYLEAGLPVLVSSRWQAVAAIVRRFNCGLVVEDHERPHLRARLREVDPVALRHGALRAREALSMDAQIHRLIQHYRPLVTTNPGGRR